MNNLANFLLNPVMDKLVAILILSILIYVASRYVQQKVAGQFTDVSRRRQMRKTISMVSFVLIILVTIALFGNQLDSLTVYLGLATAGIAFALQEVIVSAAGWIQISVSDYYNIGDRIKLGGVTGDVIGIGLLNTTMMEIGGWVNGDLYNGRIVRVANSNIYSDAVYNYSGDFSIVWDEITIPIKYGSDRQLARETLERIVTEVTLEYTTQAEVLWPQVAEKYDVEDVQVEPMVTLIANDNWLEYTVRYVTTYHKRRRTKDELFRRILDEFDQLSGRLTIASGTYDIVGLPTLQVRLNDFLDAKPGLPSAAKSLANVGYPNRTVTEEVDG